MNIPILKTETGKTIYLEEGQKIPISASGQMVGLNPINKIESHFKIKGYKILFLEPKASDFKKNKDV